MLMEATFFDEVSDYKSTIAPDELIKKDFDSFVPKIKVSRGADMRDILRAQSVLGHAISAHRVFREKFPNTTINHVLNAINRTELRNSATEYIKETYRFLMHILDVTTGQIKPEESYLYDKERRGLRIETSYGHPLFDLKYFNDYVIRNPNSFLQGAGLFSQVDSADRREQAIQRFPVNLSQRQFDLGYGTCHVADLEQIINNEICLKSLANNFHTKEDIIALKNMGVIVENKKLFKINPDPNHINVYVRLSHGKNGICDDATMNIAALLRKKSTSVEDAVDFYLGESVIDTADTIDKISAVNITGGADEFIGNKLMRIYKIRTGKDLISDDELYMAIYLGSKTNTHCLNFSSSVRYFNEIQNSDLGKLSTHEAHLRHLRTGEIPGKMSFGFQGFPSREFYHSINERIRKVKSQYNI